MATYPTGIFTYTNRTGTQTLAVGTHSTAHNADAAEIIAVETELGTNPKGIYPNVRSRLEGIEASIGGAGHTQNTDVGTSSATFYLNGASGLKIKENGTSFSLRNNTDTLYVDFICDDITCSSINGISAATLATINSNSHTHANIALLNTYAQTEVNLADAVTKKHTQNTDTGSTNETFQLNNGNALSAKVKVDDLSPTIVDIRNGADSAFAPIRALEFRGDLTVNNADPNLARIRFNDGTDRWQFSNDGITFIDFFPAAGSLSIVDTATVDLTLSGGGVLTADVITAGVNHNTLLNYEPNRHIDHTAVSISGGTGLTGGGTIDGNRTISLSHLGIQNLTDPGAHRLIAWDDTDGSMQWVTMGAGLTYTQATHTLSGLTVAGAVNEVQYNNGSSGLAAEAVFYYNPATDTLYVPNINVSGLVIGAVVAGGTTSDTWEINSDGNGLIFDTFGMGADSTILGTDLVTTVANSHVAATVLDTASIDFGITGQQITGSVLPAGVDHNSLNNYSANRHIDHTAVSISAGTGLTGGGDISANRTISLSHLGIQNLTDPGADRIMFWDESSNYVDWLTLGTGLTTTGTTINVDNLALDNLTDVIITAPTVDHILRYNGSNWVNGPETNVNSGSGVDYFPDTTASDIGGYASLSKSPQSVVEQDYTAVCNNNTVLIEEFASPVAGIGGTQIDAGVWTFDIWAYTSLAALATNIQIEVYKRTTAPVETLLFTVTSPNLTTTLDVYSVISIQQAFAINSDDRLVIKVYGVTANLVNTTVHYAFGGTTHYSHVNTPLVVRHNDIAGLQGGSGTERYHMTQAQNTALHVAATAGTGIGVAGQVISLSHLGIQNLTDPGAHRLMAWDDTDGYVNWVTIGTGLTYTQATHTLTAAGGATLTRATFTNASLTAGVLTITHSAGLSAPYTVMVTIFDNNSQQIIPDSITGATNTVAVDLSSYVTAGGGSITGTWGYGYIA